MEGKPDFVYVGTYTRTEPHVIGRAEGILVLSFDQASGALRPVGMARGVPNPSFLAVSPHRRTLYAVSEVPALDGEPGGALTAFAIDAESGELTELNRTSTGSAGPCYVSVDRSGSFALAANYGGGAVTLLPIEDDGRLAAGRETVQHTGRSVHPERQQAAHPHSIVPDPTGRVALVPDLGLDRIVLYRLDAEAGKLVPARVPWVATRPGAGPRHLAFHPGGRHLFVCNELDSTVTAYAYDAEEGLPRPIQTVSSLPEGFSGTNYPADIHVHPSGRFLYASNRGHDSIAIFAIDEASGELAAAGHQSTQGRSPRNFAIDPEGRLLLAANQNSNTIVAFAIDRERGTLEPTGAVTEVPTPVCVQFLAG
jgi:6-phosphogluconolactonase